MKDNKLTYFKNLGDEKSLLGVKIAQILSLAELSIKKDGEFVRNNAA